MVWCGTVWYGSSVRLWQPAPPWGHRECGAAVHTPNINYGTVGLLDALHFEGKRVFQSTRMLRTWIQRSPQGLLAPL